MQKTLLRGSILLSILIVTCASAVTAVPVGPPQIPGGPAGPTASGMENIIKPGTILTYDAYVSEITTDQYGISSQSPVVSFDWVVKVEEASGGHYAGTAELIPRSGTVESQVHRWSYIEGQQNPDWYGPPLWVDPGSPAESAGTYGKGTWQLLGDPMGLKMPNPFTGTEQSVNQMEMRGPGIRRYISYDTDYGTVLLYTEKTDQYFMSFWSRPLNAGGLTGPFGGLVP
ncbi:hypothetical protein [Methanoculleus sp. 10]|uniref:hypothetical protein n=1 Tax=Methanoculleus sp. 10 TaxID=430615 RepID=UPI0025FF18A8|nr:hypothetical protein [Methanoculleus sp. 10]